MTCIDCGEIYTREEVEEWEEDCKVFILDNEQEVKGNLICPRCTAKMINAPADSLTKDLMLRAMGLAHQTDNRHKEREQWEQRQKNKDIFQSRKSPKSTESTSRPCANIAGDHGSGLHISPPAKAEKSS